MSFLNLMRNKLKPKEVNDALMNITNPPAEDITYDNTSSGLTATDVQSAIDEINTDVNAISFDTIATVTALENETFAEIIDRLRDDYFDDLTKYRQITMDIDSTTAMIFHCDRWAGKNISIWTATKPTSDTSMTIIEISMSSTTVSVRKYVTSASGVACTNISDTVATGSVTIQGLKF